MLPSKRPQGTRRRPFGIPHFKIGDQVMANGKAPGGYRDRRGHITEMSADGAECRVEFEDGLQPTTGYLLARWLDH